MTAADGDILRWMSETVRPLEKDEVLAEFLWETDDNGFRIPAMTSDDYPIVALGDSYTMGLSAPSPWTDYLASELAIPILNLGVSGYGTRDQANVFADFRPNDPQWVLIAYYEGNDLKDLEQPSRPLGIRTDIIAGYIIHFAAEAREDSIVADPDSSTSSSAIYPITAVVGDHAYPLAFFDPYIWILNGEEATYRASQNIESFQAELTRIINLADDACVTLIYLPTKAHVFLPTIDAEDQQHMLERSQTVQLGGDGWLTLNHASTSVDLLLSRLDNQKRVIQSIAASLDVLFLDLTPEFRLAAMDGKQLYYTYDSHLDDSGQRVVALAIADFMRSQSACKLD